MRLDSKEANSNLAFRLFLGFNTLLLIISWTPWFAGTLNAPGLADRLFNSLRFGGFRLDIVWLVGSFLVTGITTTYYLVSLTDGRRNGLNAALGALWCLGFLLYVRHILVSGLLYMG